MRYLKNDSKHFFSMWFLLSLCFEVTMDQICTVNVCMQYCHWTLTLHVGCWHCHQGEGKALCCMLKNNMVAQLYFFLWQIKISVVLCTWILEHFSFYSMWYLIRKLSKPLSHHFGHSCFSQQYLDFSVKTTGVQFHDKRQQVQE